MMKNLLAALLCAVVCSVVVTAQSANNAIQLRRGSGALTLNASSGGSYSLTFPSSDGTVGQVLSTNGSGTLSWSSAGGAASLDDLTDAVMQSQSWGSYSIGLGVDALKSFNDVQNNISHIAIGTRALEFLGVNSGLYGQSHIAIGTEAHRYDEGAAGDIAIGHYALQASTVDRNQGQTNIAIGSSAIRFGASSDGTSNIAIGHQAMDNNRVSGNSNIVLGSIVGSSVYTTAADLTSGSRNIIVGSMAGNKISSGSGNIIIGIKVASETPEGATGFINDVGSTGGIIDVESNYLVIDNRSSTNPLIVGNFEDDWIRLNGSLGRVVLKTSASSPSVAPEDSWIVFERSTGNTTVTLPSASTYKHREIMMKTTENRSVSSNASNVVPLTGGAAGTAILPATDGAWATLVSDGTNWIIMQSGSPTPP
jgi:hypothetical protein